MTTQALTISHFKIAIAPDLDKINPMSEIAPKMKALPTAPLLDETTYAAITEILSRARQQAYAAVNFAMVEAYWLIGKQIVEKQGGGERAEYGRQFLQELAGRLTQDYGKGFALSNLRNMRQFYRTFPIRQTLSGELSWSHYLEIMKVENPQSRDFYLAEAVKSHWSVRQLQRQILTHFHARLLASQDRQSVAAEIQRTAPGPEPRDFIKNPYVLEFLDIPPSPELYEKDLESAIIAHLQAFLLELGRGFSLVARQRRIHFDGQNFYIDLVFYHYVLKCFVLIDLKIGELTHQDLGQMQMYVNYYTRELMNEGDNPPIGLILCADQSDAVVKYTLAEDNRQIFASKYRLYLPTEDELKKELQTEMRRKIAWNQA